MNISLRKEEGLYVGMGRGRAFFFKKKQFVKEKNRENIYIYLYFKTWNLQI
jgi:hypothetical protein